MKSGKQKWLYPLSIGVTLALGAMTSIQAAELGIIYNSGGESDNSSSTLGYVFRPQATFDISGLGVFAGGSDDIGVPQDQWQLQTDRTVVLWETDPLDPSINLGEIARVVVPQADSPDRRKENAFFFMPIQDVPGTNTFKTLLAGSTYMLGVFYSDQDLGDKVFSSGLNPLNASQNPIYDVGWSPSEVYFSGNTNVVEFPTIPNFSFDRLAGNFLIGPDYPPPSNVTTASLSVSPASQTSFVGDPLSVDLRISGLGNFQAPSLASYDLTLTFDPNLLSFSGLDFGDPTLGDLVNLNSNLNDSVQLIAPGVLRFSQLSSSLPAALDAVQPSGFTLARANFTAIGEGSSLFDLTANSLEDQSANQIEVLSITDGNVTIRPASAKVPEPNMSGIAFGLTLGLSSLMMRRRSNEN